jgi:replicative DNA helicase
MLETFDTTLFEYVICQQCLKDAAYLSSIVDYFDPSYFNNADVKTILTKIIAFFEKRKLLPNATELRLLLNTLEEKQYLITLSNVIKTLDKNYNVDELYERTEQFLREKAVFGALLKTTKDLAENRINTTKILESFNNACGISLIDNIGLNFFEEINKISDEIIKPNNVISTGWKWLDEKIDGGWQAKGRALYVFTGFTNVGKSIYLGNIATNTLKLGGKTVVLITLEMPETMYAKRICSNITKIPLYSLTNSITELKASLYSFKNEYNSTLIIKEFPTKSMTIYHFNSFIQKLIKKGIKPDLIIVDYLNLMKNRKNGNSSGTYEEIKETSEQLRASTYLFEVPIITATQLNRKGAGKEDPGMETISESIGVSFTADVQLSIWSDQNDKKLGVSNLGIQKNRFGPNAGSTKLKIDYGTLLLEEFEESPLSSVTDQQIDDNSVDASLRTLQNLNTST